MTKVFGDGHHIQFWTELSLALLFCRLFAITSAPNLTVAQAWDKLTFSRPLVGPLMSDWKDLPLTIMGRAPCTPVSDQLQWGLPAGASGKYTVKALYQFLDFGGCLSLSSTSCGRVHDLGQCGILEKNCLTFQETEGRQLGQPKKFQMGSITILNLDIRTMIIQ